MRVWINGHLLKSHPSSKSAHRGCECGSEGRGERLRFGGCVWLCSFRRWGGICRHSRSCAVRQIPPYLLPPHGQPRAPSASAPPSALSAHTRTHAAAPAPSSLPPPASGRTAVVLCPLQTSPPSPRLFAPWSHLPLLRRSLLLRRTVGFLFCSLGRLVGRSCLRRFSSTDARFPNF